MPIRLRILTALLGVVVSAVGLSACGPPKRISASHGELASDAATPSGQRSATPTATPSSPATAATSAAPPTSVAPRASAPAATPAPSSAPTPSCPYPSSGFDCDFQRRFAAAEAYWKPRPGTVGIVVRDRVTGAVWRNGYAGTLVWTASTVKLAMSVDLLLRDRDGRIQLTDADRGLIHNMLDWSHTSLTCGYVS